MDGDIEAALGHDGPSSNAARSLRETLDPLARHAQKLDTLGSLAGGIAHDFSNLLTPILGTTEQLLRDRQTTPTTAAGLRRILGAAHRAKQAVDRVLLFARRVEEGASAPLSIPALAREALQLIEHSLPQGISVSTAFDDSCPEVWGSSDEILQAITNLCVNACQALRHDGTRLTLRVERAPLGPTYGSCSATSQSAALRVVVEDDGPGMTPEVLARIFEPFFTTKQPNEGSGMGLSMVRAIATRHGGTVIARSTAGHGACFELVLPIRSEKSKEDAVGVSSPLDRDRSARAQVVCVDDEVAVLKTFELILTHAGHEVMMFASPVQALSWFRANPNKADLVITDQTMPDLSGIELADQLYAFAPNVPIILISGYADVSEDAPRPNIKRTLCKPVGYEALLRAVGETLPKS